MRTVTKNDLIPLDGRRREVRLSAGGPIEGTVETPRLQVNTFPSDDDEFARFVAELVAAISGASEGVVAWLEATLRERYPQAAVAKRSELADMFPLEPLTVYAYRDGSPLPAPKP